MGKSIKLSLSVLLVISVLWKPVYSDKCNLGCKGSPTAPSFLSGHSYNYGVEGTVSIYLSGAEKQETNVKLLGQVSVTAIGNCVHELKVQNLAISGPDGKKYSSPPGTDKPVRFTLAEGRAGAEICAEEGDTRRSLNIKRAIISLLQTESKPSTQVDIFGACPTDVTSSREGGAVLVHRSRDLSRCAHREQGTHDLLTGVYNPTAEIKTTQVLQSSLHVESKVNQGVPEKVSATEEYLYRPFSVGENGARARVHTKLTLTGKGAGAASGDKCTQTRTIIFEAPHGHSSAGSNAEAVVGAVKDTAKNLGSEANSKSAGEFAQLVRILRTASKDDLIRAFGQVKGNSLEKRVFLDGLLRAGTGYSIEAAIEMLKRRELSGFESELVLLSLGNAKHVNNEALKAAAGILDTQHQPKEMYLGVGALAGSYCRDHNCHTTKSDGVAAITEKLISKLQNCKPRNKIEEDTVVAVLKGIRNIHHLEDGAIEKLIRCANDNGVKSRVRVAAIEAFSADPCATKLHKVAQDLMKNRQLDSEIRIKAYMAVIQCPCAQSASEIKHLLETEPVHQVGRFITTSLRHIRSTANPDRRLQREHYGQIRTPNRFNVDDRKYSFYREMSFNVDALGVGGSAEETVIYSQDSFLPRSASLNLTAELFGHSLNVLEIGGRQGNLDRVLEHFLGPRSIFRTQEPQTIYDDLVKRFGEMENKVKDAVGRGRRSVKTDVDNFDKRLKAEGVSYNNELDLDIYLKMFGTDAIFLSLGDDKGFDMNSLLDRIITIMKGGADTLKNFQHEIRAHLLFIDAELAYPTSTGFPLKLDLVGSATARLDVGTNVDLRQIYRSPKNAKIDFKLIPSTDIEISGTFLVDADAVSTGLKVITNLHSSTGGHVVAKVLEDGRGIDLQFGMPVEKQEILTASSDLLYFSAEKGRKEKQTPLKVDIERKEYTGCFDQLSGLLGLTLCGEVSVPFSVSGPDAQASISKFIARYPLTGPAKLKLALEKNDLKGYHIKGVVRNDNPERQSFELLFEAEGSRNRRTSVSGELIQTNQEKSLKLSVESPIKTLSGQIAFYNKPTERIALVKAKIDSEEYYARAGFMVQGNERRSVFKPIIEYQIPDKSGKHNLKVDGQLIREINGPLSKYTFEGIKITIPNSNEIVDVNGHVSHDNHGVELDMKAKKGEHNMLLSGSFKNYDAKLEFQNTLNPYINFKINGHFENKPESYHNDVDLYYGPDPRNQQNRVKFNQLLKYHQKSGEDFSMITKNKFEILALPLMVEFNADADPKKVDVKVGGQYFDKTAIFDLEARTHIRKPGDYSVMVNADVDKKGIKVLAKRDIISAEKSNLENTIELKGLGKYELSGVVLHKVKQNDVNVGANGHLTITNNGKGVEKITFDVGVTENSKAYSSHAKIGTVKGVILDYHMNVNRGANPNGQLNFDLKDTISAKGNFKVTDSDGKGNGMVIVDFKKSQRKIKGDVKFQVKDPVYNIDADVYLNFEKDNNDLIRFSTHNKGTAKLIESKNKIEYSGKKTEVNIHRDGSLSDGKSHANVEVVLPTERYLTLKLDQDVNVKDNVVNGQVEYVLSDATKRGGPASSISFKSKATNTNYETRELNFEGQLEIKLKEGKTMQNSFFLKNIPSASGTHKFDFKNDLTGNLVPNPASISLTGTTSIDKGVHEKYKLKGNYGRDYSFELEEDTQVKSDKGHDKWSDDFTLSVRLPFEKAHDLKWSSNLLLLKSGDDTGEFTVIESLHLNGEIYKLDSNGKCSKNEGFGKVKVLIPHSDPLVLEANYKTDTESDVKRASVELKSQYGRGKTATIAVGAHASPQESGLVVQAHAPQAEKLKKIDVQIITKRPAPDSYSVLLTADADGRVYSYDTLAIYSKVHPVIDIKYKSPSSPKQSRVYIKGNVIDQHQGKVEVKIENVRDLSLDAHGEIHIQKDNVAIKYVANSEKLGWKNYKVDISSKDAATGKRLEFHATNDNKNVLSGSTSFISKQEGSKTIIEGSGSVKVREEQKSANFKYIRTLLTEGQEQGVETFLNWAIGERSYVAESRVTNLEYKNSYVYCEEKKQCANAEIQSKIAMPKPGTFQHVVNAGFDLRKLGFAPEFGLQISNEVSEKRLPQYTLDLHINKEDKKYYLHVYSQPEHGKFPAGITVTLPHRVLALESTVVYPTNKAMPFPIRGEVALHLDKNKPQQKTAARFLVDVNGNDQHHTATAEFGFSHPKLGREALIKLRGNVARPNENSWKIETGAIVSHPTLGNDREGKVLFEVNPVHIKFFASTPLVKIIDLEGNAVVKDNLQQGDLKFSLLEGKPVTVHAIARDFTYYEFTTGYSDEAERKLSIVGRIEPEKRMEISADVVLGREKKNIAHGALFIQDNLVKSDYGVSQDNFRYFVTALQNDLTNLEQRIKQLGEKAGQEFKNILHRVEPTMKSLEQAYREDLEKLYKEVASDQTLKEISEALHEVIHFLAKLIDDVYIATKPAFDKICQTISKTSNQIIDGFEKQILPQLKEIYQSISTIVKQNFEGLIDLVAHFAAIVTDFFEKHKPELEELTNTIAEIFKDLTRLLVAQMKEIRGKLAQIFSDITQQIKELPLITMLKEKWQELAINDQAVMLLQEVNNNLRGLLPTDESRNFVDALFNYVQKKLRQEKVDDVRELRVVYEKFAVALTSVVQFLRNQFNEFGIPTAFNLGAIPFIGAPGQATAPGFGGAVSFSVISQILKGDLPDPLSIIRAYRPRSLNPLDEIPSKLRGVVVNGQHIFTFDGRHLTFPGNCRYVLVHDHVDRNFTLVMQLANGVPKSLALQDKSGTTIEIKDNGQVALNGANNGFPVIEKDVFAFTDGNGRVGLGSLYGLMVICTSAKFEMCYIDVNGFYLGKLRGLLGDGNNEPYDDFRMVNGKITNSESEFGNSYKLASSCPAVKTPAHTHDQHHAALPPACEKIFGASSTLRPLSLLLDITPFRQACIHAVASSDPADALRQACDLGRGYTALAVSGLLPAVLPPVCLQCTDADTPRQIGDTYELKLPNKQADIVVTVETTIANEKNYKSLVVPLVSQLVDNLKKEHITDIKVYLVGVTSKFPYPIFYDTDLKLKNPKVKFDDQSRYRTIPTIHTGIEKFDLYQTQLAEIVNVLRIQFGATNVVASYAAIAQLPLRAGAVKHTISVVGERCHGAFFLLDILRAYAYKVSYEHNAKSHTLVTVNPVKSIGGGKSTAQVVGYTKSGVLLLGDKKQSKDSDTLRASLKTDSYDDACVSFIENSDGLVLLAPTYHSGNPGQQKQWLQTAAGAIAEHMLHDSLVQECVCSYVDPFRVRSVCINKERKEAARGRK